MSEPRLKRINADAISRTRRDPVDQATLKIAGDIIAEVQAEGEIALRRHAEKLGDIAKGAPLVFERSALNAARDKLPTADRALLERTAQRIAAFAAAQKRALSEAQIDVPGGRAGHLISPVERAGCYAPGGRFPLPSSVLMTAVTARTAGVGTVWVASPKPTPVTLAAAAIADADALLCVGGAQAIAALTYGAGNVPACDAVVGPGNRFVTAAKQLVAGRVAIDMLAGPSELLVLADDTADPEVVAADLLGQAEHDPDAFPALVTTHAPLIDAVNAALERQLATLPTRDTASAALSNGFAVHAADIDEAIDISNLLAPEHLELKLADVESIVPRLKHYGGLFIGTGAAEVFGDYGIGPNHVLPTGTSARFVGGLSVFTFLRVRTWLRVTKADNNMIDDAAQLARLEGLEAHARAALARKPK